MIYGYARCSTNESRQSLKRQIRELKHYGATDETIYLEYGSGSRLDRVEFNKLLNTINSGDTIVATEVSRLSRSTQHLCEIINIVKEKQIKLIIGNSITIDYSNGEPDPVTKAFFMMSGVFAELERDMISARIKSGIKNAKANGKILGRPTTSKNSLPRIFLKYYPSYKNGKFNITELSRICDMSRTTIYKYINILENK